MICEDHTMLQSKFDKFNKWSQKADKHNFAKPAEIVNVKNDVAELFIYDAIGSDMFAGGLSAKNVADALKEAKGAKTMNIRINSPGGDVFDGLAIYNLLSAFKAEKVVHIDGLAASIASVIAMAGDKVIMASESEMMVHQAWTVTGGNSSDIKKVITQLDNADNSIKAIYERKTGMKQDKLHELMAAETWMTSAEALDMKFADSIYTPSSKFDNSVAHSKFAELRNKVASPIELMRMRSKKG